MEEHLEIWKSITSRWRKQVIHDHICNIYVYLPIMPIHMLETDPFP